MLRNALLDSILANAVLLNTVCGLLQHFLLGRLALAWLDLSCFMLLTMRSLRQRLPRVVPTAGHLDVPVARPRHAKPTEADTFHLQVICRRRPSAPLRLAVSAQAWVSYDVEGKATVLQLRPDHVR